MKAIAIVTPGQGDFNAEEIYVGNPLGHEVLIEIKAAGVTRLDWNALRHGTPMVIGFEGAGIVKGLGEKVQYLQVDDHVLLHRFICCGYCSQCKSGRTYLCDRLSPIVGKNPLKSHANLKS